MNPLSGNSKDCNCAVSELNASSVVFNCDDKNTEKSINELIYNSKLVLIISPDGFDPSTVILESIILKKPVINLVLDNKFYDFSYERQNAVISISNENNLYEEIQKILNDSSFRNKIIFFYF